MTQFLPGQGTRISSGRVLRRLVERSKTILLAFLLLTAYLPPNRCSQLSASTLSGQMPTPSL